MSRILRGAMAGVLATLPMSLVMLAGKVAGLMHTPPPKEITGRAARDAGVDQPRTQPKKFHLAWLAAHVGYGAGCGALYAVLHSVLWGSRRKQGLLYGLAVWAASYLGAMPALGLYPWPSEDDTSRAAVTIAAHVVYGVALAEIDERLPIGS